jgi:hypothetical protein
MISTPAEPYGQNGDASGLPLSTYFLAHQINYKSFIITSTTPCLIILFATDQTKVELELITSIACREEESL